MLEGSLEEEDEEGGGGEVYVHPRSDHWSLR